MSEIRFSGWLRLREAREQDVFDPHPDQSTPEGGSTHHVYRLKGRDGGDYWSKSAASDLQTVNEYLAWNIYRLFGVAVSSDARLVVRDGSLRLVARQVPGRQFPLGRGGRRPAELRSTDVHEGFLVDALLGHWDVVGMAPRSNLFVDDENRAVRIDLGGMDFRAQGARKSETIPGSWGGEVSELGSMAGIGGPPMRGNSADVFADMGARKLAEACRVFKRVSWPQVEATVRRVGSEVEALAEEHGMPDVARETDEYLSDVSGVLRSRFEDLHSKIERHGLDRGE